MLASTQNENHHCRIIIISNVGISRVRKGFGWNGCCYSECAKYDNFHHMALHLWETMFLELCPFPNKNKPLRSQTMCAPLDSKGREARNKLAFYGRRNLYEYQIANTCYIFVRARYLRRKISLRSNLTSKNNPITSRAVLGRGCLGVKISMGRYISTYQYNKTR